MATVLNCVFEAGFCSNHASVKYLIEWMMILILVHYPHHMDGFWACFTRVSSLSGSLPTRKHCITGEIVQLFSSIPAQDHDKTKTSICTFLSVLVHFNVIILHLKDKVKPLMFFLRSDNIVFASPTRRFSLFVKGPAFAQSTGHHPAVVFQPQLQCASVCPAGPEEGLELGGVPGRGRSR